MRGLGYEGKIGKVAMTCTVYVTGASLCRIGVKAHQFWILKARHLQKVTRDYLKIEM